MPGPGAVVARSARRTRAARWAPAVLLACASVMLHAGGASALTAVDVEAQFAARVNGERAAAGRAALTTRDDLAAVARNHSVAMAAANRLYHNTELAQQVQGWLVVGENVGMGMSVDEIHAALMGSATHRGEILDTRFTDLGVGVVLSGDVIWVTEVFRTAAAAPASASAPPPVPPAASVPDPTAAPAPDPAPAAAATTAEDHRPPVSLPVRQARKAATAVTTTQSAPAAPGSAAPATPPPTAVPPTAPPTPADATLTLQAAGSSIPLPAPAGPAAAGVAAAALLWAVSAGMVKVAITPGFGPTPGPGPRPGLSHLFWQRKSTAGGRFRLPEGLAGGDR
ncbi:MAG TPA: CAP domain-containing protein [Acidimicrobiales bacterium]|nr:CAP domain-containing protein [Acidimicrobiales bacterium]